MFILRLSLLLASLSLLFSCASNGNKQENTSLIMSHDLAILDDFLLPKIKINDQIKISEESRENDIYKKQLDVLSVQFMLKSNKYQELMKSILYAENVYLKTKNLANENALMDLYYSFYINRIDYSDYFENWIVQYPGSHIPYIARGIFRSALAWKYRGSKFIQKTEKIRLTGMELLFEAAIRDFNKALQLQQNSLPAHLYLVSLKKTGAFGSMHDAFYEAREHQPNSRYLVEWYTTNLEPWWGGKEKHWEKLINHLNETTPEYVSLVNGLNLAIKAEGFKRDKDNINFRKKLKLANEFEENFYSIWLNYKEKDLYSSKHAEVTKLLKGDFSWNRHLEEAIDTLSKLGKYQQCIQLSDIALMRGVINSWILNDRAFCYVNLGMGIDAKESLIASLKYQPRHKNKWAANLLIKINQILQEDSM